MSSASSIVAQLNSLGVVLTVDGDRLGYSPRDVVTDDLLRQMKSHKAELLTLLVSAKCDRCGGVKLDSRPADIGPSRVFCADCGRYLGRGDDFGETCNPRWVELLGKRQFH